MLPDYSTMEVVTAIGGTVTAGGIITMLLHLVKDYFPTLRGRAAMAAVHITSLLAAVMLIISSGPDYGSLMTYLGAFVVWLGLTVTARGIYHTLFQSPASKGSVE